MSKTLEFFYDHSSPFSYLASTQLEALGRRTGAEIVWRPFLLGAVFKATQNVGPLSVPAKVMYLVKDLQDWARAYGLPEITLPDEWPVSSLKANRLSLVAQEEGKLIPFSQRVFRAHFAEGRDTSSPEVLAAILAELGLDPTACLARADSQPIKDRLRQNTDEAVARGAFGAPTFFIGDDMYMGNDRLHFVEKALR